MEIHQPEVVLGSHMPLFQLHPKSTKRNSIAIGGLAGFGIGAVLGTTVGAEACLHEPRWHCAVKVGVPLAAIGVFIGWLHK